MADSCYTYPFARPMLTVDCVILSLRSKGLAALLIRRKDDPFAGRWALPGGFVEEGESLPAAAARELREETGVTDVYLEQFQAFGDPGRDPRGHAVTVAFLGMAAEADHRLRASDDAAEAAWRPLTSLPELAFDHGAIIACAIRKLRLLLDDPAVGSRLLPPGFTVNDLRRLYSVVFGETIDEWDFRRRVLALGLTPRLCPPPRSGAARLNGTQEG